MYIFDSNQRPTIVPKGESSAMADLAGQHTMRLCCFQNMCWMSRTVLSPCSTNTGKKAHDHEDEEAKGEDVTSFTFNL
jgi:hypothetical protein